MAPSNRGAGGVVAAGHPLTAQAGARVLREGGNAVDAAVAAMLTSFAAEPLLTGLGAGGYLMVAGGDWEPALLDFFVEAPPRAGDGSAAELVAIDVSFGDAAQVFHIGPASCGVYGTPAGACEAIARWGTAAAGGARAARRAPRARGSRAQHRPGLRRRDPRAAAASRPPSAPRCGRRAVACCARARSCATPSSATRSNASEREGAAPFYRGDVAAAVSDWLTARGGSVARAALAAYRAIAREPVRMDYRDRVLLTNPPPSAGGTLIAYALGLLDRAPRAALAARGRRRDGSRAGRAHRRVRRGPRAGGLPRAVPRGAPRRRGGSSGQAPGRRGTSARPRTSPSSTATVARAA